MAFQGQHLFPNLHTVTVNLFSGDSTAYLPLLLSSRLKIIQIINRNPYASADYMWGDDVALFLMQIQPYAAQIECLNTNLPSPKPSFFASVASFTRLKELKISIAQSTSINYTDLLNLSKLEHLTDLNLTARSFTWHSEGLHTTPLTLPKLCYLSICCLLGDLTKLLLLSDFPVLTNLIHRFMLPTSLHPVALSVLQWPQSGGCHWGIR
ncbi:hypothetical protein CVT24_006612 [Panaeolus cyanescens]|uniref:Uncharacterized protein n=1 Tax=Panaeolus cyanescens TaxID=181874 RepID=A0A409X173_9AGAR|nr:hypothetical protein CVT24_006612 [Panaeolus cyanescens]